MKKISIIFGTRLETIKLAPVILELKKHPEFEVNICVTAQHREMLDQVLEFFKISLDFNLDLMAENQDLTALIGKMITSLNEVIVKTKPSYIIVQGDTTTAYVGALLGFLNKIKIDNTLNKLHDL